MKINFLKLDNRAHTPKRGSDGAAGADLYAITDGELMIAPHTTVLIHTGLAVQIPDGYCGLVFARSGLASKQGLAPANKVGLIDSDYRGEIMVALHNHTDVPKTVTDGERVAQLVIMPYIQADYVETDSLTDTIRGAGGFGSTGTK